MPSVKESPRAATTVAVDSDSELRKPSASVTKGKR